MFRHLGFQQTVREPLCPEDEGTTIRRNVVNYLPNDTA